LLKLIYSDIIDIVDTNAVNHIEIVYPYSIVMYMQVASGRVARLQFTRINEEDIKNSEFKELKILGITDFNPKGLLKSIITNDHFDVISVASYFYPEKDTKKDAE